MNPQNTTPTKSETSTFAKPAPNRRSPRSQAGDGAPAQPSALPKQVAFELEAGGAKEVLLAGDFTAWQKTPIKLRKSERGTWQTTVALAPGQYHYRFVVDGQWRDDPRARVQHPNPYGGCDSVLEIA